MPQVAPPPSAVSVGAFAWLRANFFASIPSSLLSLAMLALLATTLPGLLRWLIIDSVWGTADPAVCRAAGERAGR